MPPSVEQQRIVDHDPSRNGRVLAGPGTGKSWTSIALIKSLRRTHPHLRIRMLTFTRAAAQDLARKVGDAKLSVPQPSTIHSFALTLLMRHPQTASMPTPLRISDSWEAEQLIRRDLARCLRELDFEKVTVRMVKKLEQELSARWQSLDDSLELLADLQPQLRNAYVGLWQTHRHVYGYTLLSELPFRAGNAVEDFGAGFGPVDFLIVDEYQDLNEADIRLIRLLQERGCRILAIGDDDQSIYSFRMAAPEGIRRFPHEFGDCEDYRLSISQRCGENILDAATMLIETTPGRPRKPSITFKEGANPGRYWYLRFDDDKDEVEGVADLIHLRHRAGVPLREIAVLVRSQVDTWARQLIPALAKRGIEAVDTDSVKRSLHAPELRVGLATLRLVVDREDSLAWWTLLKLEKGVAEGFCDYIYGMAARHDEAFGAALLRLYPAFSGAPAARSARAAAKLVSKVLEHTGELDVERAKLGQTGWGGWTIDVLDRTRLTDDVVRMFEKVGRAIRTDRGLGYFLGQLEPVARDLATQSDGVRIMTMTASKGLTVNTCVVMGVERNLIPHPRGRLDEECRLLYVAMTRAEEMCVLTFAARRKGQIARHGAPNVGRPRGRCPLLENLPIGQWRNGRDVLDEMACEDAAHTSIPRVGVHSA